MSQPWKMPEESSQMPLGIGDPSSDPVVEEIPAEPGRRKKIDRGSAIMFGIFCGGVGMIYLLGLQTRPPVASAATRAADARLNTQIKALLGKSSRATKKLKLSSTTDRLIALFYKYPGKEPPPASAVRQNPFVLKRQQVAAAPLPSADAAALARRRMKALARAYHGLQLQTILYSRRSATAMINNRMVQKGDRIGRFSVKDIQPDKVLLVASGNVFALRISQ